LRMKVMRQTLLVLLCAGCWTVVHSSSAKKVRANLLLLGDSTIDNFCYVEKWEDTVGHQMKDYVSQVTDLAVECSRVEDVLGENTPPPGYVSERSKRGFPSYSEDVRLKLKERLQKYQPSHVLLSIIGNDVRALYHGRETWEGFQGILSNEGKLSYGQLLRTIKESLPGDIKESLPGVKLIVVMPYRKKDEPNRDVKKLANMFFEIAKVNQVPVIDLMRTFDPFKSEGFDSPHYFNAIEPNKNGATCLCKLTKKVLEDHDWSGPSKVYFDPTQGNCDTITSELNNGKTHQIHLTQQGDTPNRNESGANEGHEKRPDAGTKEAKSKLSNSEIAGIVVGVFAFVVLMAVAVYCYVYKTQTDSLQSLEFIFRQDSVYSV